NEKLRLCPPDVRRLSPLHRRLSPRELVLAYGAAELPELQRQSETFAAARIGLPGELLRVPDRNHFTILNDLASPEGILTQRACGLAGLKSAAGGPRASSGGVPHGQHRAAAAQIGQDPAQGTDLRARHAQDQPRALFAEAFLDDIGGMLPQAR